MIPLNNYIQIEPEEHQEFIATTSTTYAIATIAVAPTNPKVVYTGSVSAALFATVDGGTTWNGFVLGKDVK